MLLPPPCFTVGMVSGFLQTWLLAFRLKSWLVSSDQIILFLMVFRCLLANSSGLSCAFYWGVASVWPLYHKGLIGGVLQRWLSFWKVLPSPQRNSGALSEWPSGSWSPPWPRPFSTDCSVWPGGSLTWMFSDKQQSYLNVLSDINSIVIVALEIWLVLKGLSLRHHCTRRLRTQRDVKCINEFI